MDLPAYLLVGDRPFLYIVLDFHRHSGKHLLGAIAQDLAQDLERTVTSAVPGIDFLDIQFAQALRKGPHHFVLVAEQVEPAEKRVDFFAGEGRLDFLYDIVRAAVTAAVHDKQAPGRVEYETLFVIETVVAVLAVFLDRKMRTFANRGEARRLVRNQVHVRRNLHVAFGKADAVGKAFQEPLVDSDVFVVREAAN